MQNERRNDLEAPKPDAQDRDTSPRDLRRAVGVRPSTDGGKPANARTEQGSSSGFPGSHSVGGPK